MHNSSFSPYKCATVDHDLYLPASSVCIGLDRWNSVHMGRASQLGKGTTDNLCTKTSHNPFFWLRCLHIAYSLFDCHVVMCFWWACGREILFIFYSCAKKGLVQPFIFCLVAIISSDITAGVVIIIIIVIDRDICKSMIVCTIIVELFLMVWW